MEQLQHCYIDDMAYKKIFTLVFLKRDNRILLGHKTRGLGKGLWNGFGGKIENGESVVNCARRELLEECNVSGNCLKQLGVVQYSETNSRDMSIVHIFTCYAFEGEERPSEEMNPIKWFKYQDIPFKQMWPDAKDWYSFMLNEKFFSAAIVYTKDQITGTLIQEHDTLKQAIKIA